MPESRARRCQKLLAEGMLTVNEARHILTLSDEQAERILVPLERAAARMAQDAAEWRGRYEAIVSGP